MTQHKYNDRDVTMSLYLLHDERYDRTEDYIILHYCMNKYLRFYYLVIYISDCWLCDGCAPHNGVFLQNLGIF